MYVCIYIYEYKDIFVYMYIYICLYIYIYVYALGGGDVREWLDAGARAWLPLQRCRLVPSLYLSLM